MSELVEHWPTTRWLKNQLGKPSLSEVTDIPAVAERLRRAYPALLEWDGVGSIPANSDAQNVPSFRRWRIEMKLSPVTDVKASVL